MKQGKTDVAQIELQGLPEKPFPAGPDYRVAITRDAHDAVWRHARESLGPEGKPAARIPEVGGILLGTVYRDAQSAYLEIAAAIVAEHTVNQGTQMTFTPETWEQVNRVRDERFPKLKMVGWYHTHPNFGVFLSDMDKFTHQSHFPQPWTTAFVVDPVRETEGFFVWMAGEPRQAPEYWVGGERRDRSFSGRSAPVEPYGKKEEPVNQPEPASAVSRASFALATVAGFLALLLVFGYVYLREAQHSDTEKLVMRALEEQRVHVAEAYRDLAQLSRDLQTVRTQTAETDQALQQRLAAVAHRLENVAAIADALEARVAAHQRSLERAPEGERGEAPSQTAPGPPASPSAQPPRKEVKK